MKVITVCDTPPYGHAPTYQVSLTYFERQKCYGPDKKILFKKQLFDLEVKGQGSPKVITECDTPSYGHAPTYQISLTYLERNNYKPVCIHCYVLVLFINKFLSLIFFIYLLCNIINDTKNVKLWKLCIIYLNCKKRN